MPTDIAIADARDLTLQKIGRNVLNFQKMEAALKFILKVANFAGPVSKVREKIEAEAKLRRTKPMGHLVDLASIESCRSLCEALDAQRERNLPAYEHLESVVKAIRESHAELARNVDAIVASALTARIHGA